MFSVLIADDPYHMGECILCMMILTIYLLLLHVPHWLNKHTEGGAHRAVGAVSVAC